jgi:hypothetical protein
MQVVGPHNSASAAQLKEALASLETSWKLNWGCSPQAGDHWLANTPRKDAIEQLQAFQGVPTIEWTRFLETARAWVDCGWLVFGRRRVHSQGTDIVGPRHRDFARRDYWVKVVPNVVQEWRLHIFRGRCIARGLKTQVEPPHRVMPVRNRANGWRMVHDVEPTEELRATAKAAVKAVGYELGAVDMLVDNSNKIYVLEANRAPGLDDYTLGQYVKAITKFVSHPRNRVVVS